MKEISLIALQGRNEVQAIRCAALVLFLIGAAYADDPPPPPIPPKPLRGTLVDPDAPPLAPPPVSLPPAAPGVAPDVSSPPGCRTRMVGQSTSGLGLAGGIEVEFPAGGWDGWASSCCIADRDPGQG